MRGFESHLGQLAFFSLSEKKWAVLGGVVVLPCFVLNRSHRFNHVCACTYMCACAVTLIYPLQLHSSFTAQPEVPDGSYKKKKADEDKKDRWFLK